MKYAKPILENKKTWDTVSDLFLNACALPAWGPLGAGADLELLPEIQGKTFLELGCGSGRSIKFLTTRGAKQVCGLDFSPKQIAAAALHNREEINSGVVTLIESAMEERVSVEPVDAVVSIYAFGWTQDPQKTLTNIYSYLKPGGLFLWSWDHTIFADVEYQEGRYVVVHDYHDESPSVLKNWKREGTAAHVTYRKTSTWFRLLREAGFEIVGYEEPEPRSTERGSEDPASYYAIQKAKKVPATMIFVCKRPA